MTSAAEPIVSIVRRHGAYLLTLYLNSATEYLTTDAFADVAGSKRLARQVAKIMAEEVGFTGPWRWESNPEGSVITLLGEPPTEPIEEED